jgi:signal transduction histidine kinase
MNAWGQVALLSAAVAAAVGLMGFSVFRALARWNSRSATVLAAATPAVAFTAGLLVVAWRMFLSAHDLRVALVVSLAAGVVSVALGLVLGERLHRLEREAADERRRREVERRVEANRRDLVAWVSHDLRTPLAGLRAMAEALEDGMVDDPQRYHERMRIEVDRLSRMVDDLFQLSRIQSGTLRLSLGAVSASDLVSDTLAAAGPIAAAKGVRLDGTAVSGIKLMADGDELHRALGNLVVNAIRHTPPDGSVVVAAELSDDGAGVFAVRDGCGGIAADDLGHVFEVGWRGTDARSPGPAVGAGLGLAIVRGIVDAHDGEVSVHNVPGGCEFAIRIPASLTPNPA